MPDLANDKSEAARTEPLGDFIRVENVSKTYQTQDGNKIEALTNFNLVVRQTNFWFWSDQADAENPHCSS